MYILKDTGSKTIFLSHKKNISPTPVVVIFKLANQIYIRVNITAFNPLKIVIFVSEYTFSGALIEKVFLDI